MNDILFYIGYYIIKFLRLYYWIIFFYVILSWIFPIRQTKIFELLARIVEPYLAIFRRIIPPIAGLDFSPILAILALEFATRGFLGFIMR